MSDNLKKWAVLWSPHQEVFHIQKFGEMLEENRNIFTNKTKGDYILLGLEETQEEANANLARLKEFRDAHYGKNNT